MIGRVLFFLIAGIAGVALQLATLISGVPDWLSWVGIAVAAVAFLGLLNEARRRSA